MDSVLPVLTRLAIIILQILGIILFFYSLLILLLFSEYPAIILILFLKFAQHIQHSRASNTSAGYTILLDVEEVITTVSKVVLAVLLPELDDVSNC